MQYLKYVLIVVLQKSIRTYFGATASSFIAVLLKGEMTIRDCGGNPGPFRVRRLERVRFLGHQVKGERCSI